MHLIQKNGRPHPALVKLFAVLEIKNNGTAADLNQLAQTKFLRPPGKERWEMESFYEDKRAQILPILKNLGVLHALYPSHKTYDTVIIGGALVARMRARLKFLDDLWKQGLRAKEIIFLTGERPLDPKVENERELFDQASTPVKFRSGWKKPDDPIPKTEGEAAKMLWDQMITDPNLRSRKVFFLSVPMIHNEKTGELRRPNAIDIIDAWIDTNPNIGNYLAISNNPYVHYYQHTFYNRLKKKGLVSKGAQLETVGPAAPSDVLIAVHLDNIARWLYTEMNAP